MKLPMIIYTANWAFVNINIVCHTSKGLACCKTRFHPTFLRQMPITSPEYDYSTRCFPSFHLLTWSHKFSRFHKFWRTFLLVCSLGFDILLIIFMLTATDTLNIPIFSCSFRFSFIPCAVLIHSAFRSCEWFHSFRLHTILIDN